MALLPHLLVGAAWRPTVAGAFPTKPLPFVTCPGLDNFYKFYNNFGFIRLVYPRKHERRHANLRSHLFQCLGYQGLLV